MYRQQVDLLLQVLPHVAKENVFALKGGTAINLFVRDMPRLSVDIDLTYLPLDDRDTAIREISEALNHIRQKINQPSDFRGYVVAVQRRCLHVQVLWMMGCFLKTR